MKQIKLMQGDNILSLKKLPENSIDSIVTDAPYGLGKEQDMNIVLKDWIEKGYSEIKGKGFMGKEWDAFVPQPAFWKEAIRTLKPGGHVLCFFGSRTYDIGVMAMRLAGFEIRDTITWNFASGFPKSLNIGKAFDKKNGNEREIVGEKTDGAYSSGTNNLGIKQQIKNGEDGRKTLPTRGEDFGKITKGSSQYEGWGTALKPAAEYIVMARKPLSEKTIVDNVIKWGTGGINIDGCRVGTDMIKTTSNKGPGDNGIYGKYTGMEESELREGRFPANILFDETAAEMLDEQTGVLKGDSPNRGPRKGGGIPNFIDQENKRLGIVKENDTLTPNKFSGDGGASRFFYVAKVSKKERNLGLDTFEDKNSEITNQSKKCKICDKWELATSGDKYVCKCETPEWKVTVEKNNHPTLKPINLMTYLCRLITPPGGIILDPFMGSGSTGISACLEGFRFVGMELDEDYFKIAEARVNSFEEYRKLLK